MQAINRKTNVTKKKKKKNYSAKTGRQPECKTFENFLNI